MTNGDAAAAAGIPTVPATADARLGYDEINRVLDLLVQRVFGTGQIGDAAITTAKLADGAVTPAKLSGILPLANGGTGANNFTDAQKNIMGGGGAVPARQEPGSGTTCGFYSAPSATSLWFRGDPGSTALDKRIRLWGEPLDTGGADLSTGAGKVVTPGGRGFTVSSGWAAAAIDGAGNLGVQPSARRFKKNIRTWEDDEILDRFLALDDVTYQNRAVIEGTPDGPTLLGWIADDLQPIFPDMVPVDTDPDSKDFGLPISINYAQAVVPLHALAKRQAREITELRAGLAELRALITGGTA